MVAGKIKQCVNVPAKGGAMCRYENARTLLIQTKYPAYYSGVFIYTDWLQRKPISYKRSINTCGFPAGIIFLCTGENLLKSTSGADIRIQN
jgi:hypothetical protein